MTWDRILKIISYLGLIFNILSGIKNEILDIPDRKKKKKKEGKKKISRKILINLLIRVK